MIKKQKNSKFSSFFVFTRNLYNIIASTTYKGIYIKIFYFMKKLCFLCVMVLSLVSCSIDNDNSNDFYYEILPVESVDIPTEFVLGETYEITVGYYRPSGCYIFSDFYYASELNQRTVAIINAVYPNQNCQTFENELVEVSFNFMVNNNGTYVFRFWQGQDDNGNDLYYIVEVPVVN